MISIHTPHAGSDIFVVLVHFRNSPFQSTLPMRGATDDCHCGAAAGEFQSTLPMRGATNKPPPPPPELPISIHTPHAGSDEGVTAFVDKAGNFNPHSPCGERRCTCLGFAIGFDIFQSTLPMRGATGLSRVSVFSIGISIHTPHAGSDDDSHSPLSRRQRISIHTPHAGSDIS